MDNDDIDFEAALRQERKQSLRIARTLADAIAGKDVDAFLEAVDQMEFAVDAWRPAMARVGRLPSVTPEIATAFLNVWIQSKHIPLEVGHRPTMAKALRVLLAPLFRLTKPMTVYRGAGPLERKHRLYGFSWSQDEMIARAFAEQKRKAHGGSIVMRTTVSPEAVLLVREPEDFYDEGEVIVDPFKLGRVEVIDGLT